MADSSSIKKTGSFSAQSGGKKRAGALLAILFLFACCASSVYVCVNVTRMVRERESGLMIVTQAPDLSGISEASELQTTSDEFTSMGRVTSMVTQTALLAEISGKNPVARPTELVPRIDYEATRVETPLALEPDPPLVTVIAIMISGQDKIAMVNIMGEDTGLVIRQGTKFSGGEARITKIDEKGVTFTWKKKSYTVVM
jgi:hypothetical protein